MKEIANQFVKIMQNIYVNQKKVFSINIRGEYSILLYLDKNSKKEVTPGKISEDLNISTARVAASLNSLENKDYLTREIDKDDRRKIIIKMTTSGKEVANKLKEEHLNYLIKIFNCFDKNEITEIMRLTTKLDSILTNLGKLEGAN